MNKPDPLAADVGKASGDLNAQRRHSATGRWLHPASGAAILLLDWLLFGSDAVSGFFAVALTSFVGFISAATAVTLIQRKVESDSLAKAVVKALLAALVVAVPLPIGGTVVGSFVLAISGLGFLRKPKLEDARRVLDSERRK